MNAPFHVKQKTVTVRLARDEDGGEIRRLMKSNDHWGWDLDWSRVAPWWLVAEHDGKICGCLQVSPGLPFGRLEWLCVDGYLGHLHSKICRELLLTGISMLVAQGSQAVIGTPDEHEDTYIRSLLKRGGTRIARCEMVGRRFR